MKAWLRRIAMLAAVALVGVLSVPAATVLPLVRDDWALDRVVVAVALDWRDFGEEKARQRLQFELDHSGIGRQVSEDACTFTADEETGRLVSCRWQVQVDLPFVGRPLPLAFASLARIDRRGSLVR